MRSARRRRPHLALACVVAGLAVSPAGPIALAAVAAVAVVGGALVFGGRAGLVAATLVVAAFGWGSARVEHFDRLARAAPPGSVIDGEATLLEHPRRTRFGKSAPMTIDTGPARGLRVFARMDGDATARAG